MPQPTFRELQFGQVDASQEAAEQPELLREGYYDYREAAYSIAARQAFLLLGPKGSGKSAVIEHLRLQWLPQWDRFFSTWDLRGFPVNDVTQVRMGQSAGASRTQAAWEFLLLLKVFESLGTDQGVQPADKISSIVDGLRAQGLITDDWVSRVSKWTNRDFTINLKILTIASHGKDDLADPLEASAFLKQQLSELQSDSQHVIALDGLDSFFFEVDDEWASLGGLVQAMLSLNRLLRETSLKITIVAALRSDIFDLLPGAENNKLKPHAVHLDWHAHGIGPDNHLWRLLTAKAQVHRPEISNIVSQYLRTPVVIGPHTVLTTYLLEHTRLLPRDAVALMGFLQKCYGGFKWIPEANAKEAVRRYCEEYFVGEIMDNISGILPGASALKMRHFQDALRSMPRRIFSFEQICSELEGELDKQEVRALLRQMFEIGGVGIYNRDARPHPYTDFVFRKVSGAAFTISREFTLHEALVRAWNVPHR
jgi:hypothetical protein